MTTTNQFNLRTRNTLLIGFACVVLGGCSLGSDTIDLTENHNVHDAVEAATGPLQDLNLRRQEIPPLLKLALSNPYAHKPKVRCPDLQTEVAQLDELLGPDMEPTDITLASTDHTLSENIASVKDMEIPDAATVKDTAFNEAGKFAKSTVIDTIKNKTNILPFRSIIRKISGADKHQRKLEDAYQAGKLRRAYLKGLAEMHFGEKCLAKPAVVEAKVESKDGVIQSAAVASVQ